MRLPNCLLLAAFLLPVGGLQLLAQGPAPVGLQQPTPATSAPVSRARPIQASDTTHVKANHWKRGALIGALVATVPPAIWGLSHLHEEGDKGLAITNGILFLGLSGLIGALTGGMIGSFFLK